MTQMSMAAAGNNWYALVTAAYNEEAFIERPLRSIVAQSLPPRKWVIVSDGSTDRTDEIVKDYCARYPFIHLHRITEDHRRNFAAQANAINTGFGILRGGSYGYIGNLDADISLEPGYFSDLLEHFQGLPRLGLSGGMIYEEQNGEFQPRRTNNVESVAHGVQMFRRECLEEMGGYLPLPYGGPDWQAEISARMRGWDVRACPTLKAFHHRPTGQADGLLRYWYRQGLMDYSLGSHPLFEVVKLVRRIPRRPYLLGATARLVGFIQASLSRKARPVSKEFVDYLRREQMGRLFGNAASAGRSSN